ncbi:GNAT family N-acetyltransferase [Xanthobacter sp. KR7-225]|uniref:GNAT family N-acetyltransferase n=1 Tax=Xanthobacter sp. KR7-225 TaxID=3156613 RepID=UPI0032B32309
MKMPYAIADAGPHDLPQMIDLWVASWAKAMPQIDFEARRPWIVEHLAALAAGGARTRLAREAATGALAGFVVIHPETGYLDQLVVGPNAWGRGAAEALMDAARAISPSLIALDVNQDNPRAVRFYQKIGLAIVAEGENPRSGRRTFRMEWRP